MTTGHFVDGQYSSPCSWSSVSLLSVLLCSLSEGAGAQCSVYGTLTLSFCVSLASSYLGLAASGTSPSTQQWQAQEHQLTPRLLPAQGLLQPIKTGITETPADTSPQRGDLTTHEKGSGLSSSPVTVPFWAGVARLLANECGEIHWGEWSVGHISTESALLLQAFLAAQWLQRPHFCCFCGHSWTRIYFGQDLPEQNIQQACKWLAREKYEIWKNGFKVKWKSHSSI